jgi:integrase
MRSTNPTGFVRIEQRAKGPVAYSQIRLPEPNAEGKTQLVQAIGLVHVQRVKGKWQPKRSGKPDNVLTLSECEEIVRERVRALSAAPTAPDVALTFGQAVSEWLDHIENVEQRRHSTVRDYKSLAKNHLIPEFGRDTPLSEIDFKRCDAFRSRLLREGKLSKRMVQKALILLGSIFKTAQRLHGFPSNPAALVKKGSIPRGEVLYFTMAEVERIAQAAGEQDADLFRVVALTGLRRGEIVSLRWRDVDFDGGQLSVRTSYVDGIEDTPKSHETRDVPLHPDAKRILARLSLRENFTNADDLVFPRDDGSHMSADNLSKRFTQAKKDAGLPVDKRSLHKLRNTFATHVAYAEGATVNDVQAYLGHADLVTTQRYMGKLNKRDAAVRMGQSFGLPEPAPSDVAAV